MFIVPSDTSHYPFGILANKQVLPNRSNCSFNQFHPISRDLVHFKGQQEERLLSAAESGSLESLSKLLDEVNINLDWQDSRGNTALIQAAGNADKVRALLYKGADPTIASHFGNTALMKAAQVGNLTSAKLLVSALKSKHNNFTQVINKEYNTALHLAALKGHTDIAGYLVEEGFSPTQLNLDKETPITLAKENGHTETASTLKTLSLQYPRKPEADNQVKSLFRDVFNIEKTIHTKAYTSVPGSGSTVQDASLVTQSPTPILQKAPELSPYQTLLTTFMEGQSLFDCSPQIVQKIIQSPEVFEDFAFRLKDDMDQSEQMKSTDRKGAMP
jgi:hypothetical protein